MKKTIIILVLIGMAVILGYAYEQVLFAWHRYRHPIEYKEHVMRYSEIYNIPPEIIFSVIKAESSFRSNVVSPAGAIGLMQMMPETFAWLTGKIGDNHEEGMLFDPATNIRYGTFYLNYLYGLFGDWNLVFAAYNGGQGNVRNWMSNPEIVRNGVLIIDAIPFPETRNYVTRVNRNIEMYRRLYFSD